MAMLGIPSGGVVQRLGSRTTMLISDFARAPILASIPLLYAAGVLSFGLLLGLVALLGCFMPPYFASQRTILPELVGEDETRMSQANSLIEGGSAFAALLGPGARGRAHPVHRRAERPLRRCRDVPRRVPARAGVRTAPEAGGAAVEHGVLAGLRFLLRDKLLARWRRGRRLRLPDAGMSAGLPFYAYDEFDGSSWIAGLFYAALGAGALVGSLVAVVAVRRVRAAPARGARRPRVLGAAVGAPVPAAVAGRLRRALRGDVLHAAHQRSVLAVLTARTPADLRAKVMTAVISVNTLAAPLGFLVAGQVLEHWGVVPLFTAVVIGITCGARVRDDHVAARLTASPWPSSP